MKNRDDYKQYSLYEFLGQLTMDMGAFGKNMEHLKMKDMSFPEWYELFGAWLEVDTSMEEECWK